MILIVGLGNPGEKFKNTRHNFGFMVIDAFAEKNSFPDFKFSKKFNAEISEDIFNNEKIVLAKPQTYMNESGRAIKKIFENWKATLRGVRPKASRKSNPSGSPFSVQENLVVVHDDIDLPLGEIKIVRNRGSAGHKGVESIIKEIGSKDFIRIRIGVVPKTGKPKEPEKFVLKKFDENEKNILNEIINKVVMAIETLIKDGLEKATNEYNK